MSAHERLLVYRSMAEGRMRYENSDIERAKLILPRVDELRQQGRTLVEAIEQAEKEQPPTPLPRWVSPWKMS